METKNTIYELRGASGSYPANRNQRHFCSGTGGKGSGDETGGVPVGEWGARI